MPALASLTVNDGQATPVAHTFTPVRLDEKGVATFYDRSSGIAIGFPRFTFSLKEPIGIYKAGAQSSGQRAYRSVMTIDVPKLESTSAATGTGISPAPTVAYVHSARIQLDMPERGTPADRSDLHAYAGNFLANATIKSALQNLEAFF